MSGRALRLADLPRVPVPNVDGHCCDPPYLRRLITAAGLTQAGAADLIGISPRALRQYLADRDTAGALNVPYPVQFALECLARRALQLQGRREARPRAGSTVRR